MTWHEVVKKHFPKGFGTDLFGEDAVFFINDTYYGIHKVDREHFTLHAKGNTSNLWREINNTIEPKNLKNCIDFLKRAIV